MNKGMLMEEKYSNAALQDISYVIVNGVRTQVKTAKISLASSGEVVAAVTGKKIRVLTCNFTCNLAATVQARTNNGSGTTLSGLYSFDAKSGIVLGYNPGGHWVETTAGQALYLTISSAIEGSITYIEV